jgi:hypothetical protein
MIQEPRNKLYKLYKLYSEAWTIPPTLLYLPFAQFFLKICESGKSGNPKTAERACGNPRQAQGEA